MPALGKHIILDLNGAESELLDSRDAIRTAMLDAAKICGATVISDSFHVFSPQGVTGVVCLAESHMSIHTWPEKGYAAVDVFTCGDKVKPDVAANYLIEFFKPQSFKLTDIERGEE